MSLNTIFDKHSELAIEYRTVEILGKKEISFTKMLGAQRVIYDTSCDCSADAMHRPTHNLPRYDYRLHAPYKHKLGGQKDTVRMTSFFSVGIVRILLTVT